MGSARNFMTPLDAVDTEDLPDIVEIVMEMGARIKLPSPPVLDSRQASLPAHLEKLADPARDSVDAGSSANTRRAYAADWKHFFRLVPAPGV
ncbi:hypothetical protein X743_31860 [Mesorhizobium sp. LNHC252B00]|nr:hypothetical protein X743_31860 [Mesorhizobium sp. LNHC252B00]